MAGAEARVGTALINYAAKDAGFTAATKKVNRQLTGFERQAGKAKKAAAGLTASIAGMAKGYLGIGAAIGTVLGGAGIGSFIKTQGELATKMEAFAAITGLTVTELQIFQKAMGEFALGTTTTNKALQTFTKAVGESRRGLKSYQDAFAAIGVSMADLEGLSTQEQLNLVARGLKNTEDAATRTAAAMLLFGGRGVEVAAALRQVSFENKEYVQSIIDTGIVTQKEVDRLKSVTAAYDTLGDTTDALQAKLAAGVADEWTKMLNKITEAAPVIAEVLTPAFQVLVQVITGAVGLLADVVSYLGEIIDKTKEFDDWAGGALSTTLMNVLLGPNFAREALGTSDTFGDALTDEISGIEETIRREEKNLTQLLTTLIEREIDLAAATSDSMRDKIRGAIDEINKDIDETEKRLSEARGKLESRSEVMTIVITNAFEFDDSVVQEELKVLEESLKKADLLQKNYVDGVKKYADDVNTINARRVRQQRLLQEQLSAPLNMFGGVGPNIITDEQIAQRKKYDQLLIEEARQERLMREQLTAPLNEFGGAGDSVMTPEMEKIREKYERESALIEGAIIKMSDTTRDRLAPVFAGLDNQLNNFFTSIINGTASAGEAFKNLASKIAEAVFQALVLQPLINNITGGLGSFFGIDVGQKVPGRASGGPVSARQPYVVGERGPELFVPNNAGSIVPNGGMGGAVYNFTFNHNISSTDGPGVRKALAEARPLLQQDAVEAVAQAARRPGGLRG